MLIYRRSEDPDDHIWRNERGLVVLWKGIEAWWYWNRYAEWARLCPSGFADGDAVELYRARTRLDLARVALPTHATVSA